MRTILEVTKEIKELRAKLNQLIQEKANLANKKIYLVFMYENLIRECVFISSKGNKYVVKYKGKVMSFINRDSCPYIFATKEEAEKALLTKKEMEVTYHETALKYARKTFETEIKFEQYEEE